MSFYFNHMNNEMKRALIKLVNNTKLGWMVDILEDRIVIQRDLNRLKKWAEMNIMKFKKKIVLDMGWDVQKNVVDIPVVLGNTQLKNVSDPLLTIVSFALKKWFPIRAVYVLVTSCYCTEGTFAHSLATNPVQWISETQQGILLVPIHTNDIKKFTTYLKI